jgi:RHS repeat-associated protein
LEQDAEAEGMAKAGMTELILPGEPAFSAEGVASDETLPLEASDPEAAGAAALQTAATPTADSPTTGALQNVATFYYAWDHLGTVRLVSNQDRSVVERHDYEPFGVELRPILNQTQNTHQFTGHERDQASEYDYMHFRFYGSTMGRFMKPDTILGNLANPQSWNLYSYVHGNPVNFNDPTGRMAASPDDTIPRNPGDNMGFGSDDSQGHTYNVVKDGHVVDQVHTLYSLSDVFASDGSGAAATDYSKSSFNVPDEVLQLLKGVLQRTRMDNAEAGGFLFRNNETGALRLTVIPNPDPSSQDARTKFPWFNGKVVGELVKQYGIDGKWQMLVAAHGHRDDGILAVSSFDWKGIAETDARWSSFFRWGKPLYYAVVQQAGAIFYRDGVQIRMDW